MLWNMGGTGAGIGCNSGESCSVSGSGNITATLRWVYNDADTSTAPNPPAKIALLESANAGWTGWIDNPISGAADPSQIQSLSVSGSADDGENDVFQESISGGTIIGKNAGVHYSEVDSSSGTVTKSASMPSSGTASISSMATTALMCLVHSTRATIHLSAGLSSILLAHRDQLLREDYGINNSDLTAVRSTYPSSTTWELAGRLRHTSRCASTVLSAVQTRWFLEQRPRMSLHVTSRRWEIIFCARRKPAFGNLVQSNIL